MVYLLERLWLKKRPCADTTRFRYIYILYIIYYTYVYVYVASWIKILNFSGMSSERFFADQ